MVDTLIREINPTLHTFSRPFSRFGLLKIGARSTVLTLGDGSLAIISPISLEDDEKPLQFVKEKLGGRVQLLIAPDLAHWLSIERWAREFPDAKIIGVEGHDKKTGAKVKWDTLFTIHSDVAQVLSKYSITDDIDFCYFSGFVGKDLVTLHRRSRTIVEADLIFNLPATEQYGGRKPTGLTSLMHVLNKDSVWSRRFLWYIGKKDEGQMRRAAAAVSAWDFDIIIPCHGDPVLHNGRQVWNWIFYRFLTS